MSIPMKHYWMGEDIETLSRKRLMEIVVTMARELEFERQISLSMNRAWMAITEQAIAKLSRIGSAQDG